MKMPEKAFWLGSSEGAMKVIALGYQIPIPDCVTKAIEEYRSQNDWFGHFLDEVRGG